MKLKLLKYIFIVFLVSIFLENVVYRLLNGKFSLNNIIFFKVTLYAQSILLFINLTILLLNTENYYYLKKIVFYFLQIIYAIIFLCIDEYWKDDILTIFIPFFSIQTFFYFKVKNMFSRVSN